MTVLSFHNLDSALQAIVAHFINSYNPNAVIYDLMYRTGCRYIEAQEVRRWELDGNGYCILTTSKDGEQRIFKQSELPKPFIRMIKDKEEHTATHSYRTLIRDFYGALPYRILYTGNKPIALHAFRHNYVKALMEQGKTTEEIQMKMGHKDISNTLKYINSVIYY